MAERPLKARKPSLLQKLLRAPSRRYQTIDRQAAELDRFALESNRPTARSPNYEPSVRSVASTVSIYSQPSPPVGTAHGGPWRWPQEAPPPAAARSAQRTPPRSVRPKPSLTESHVTAATYVTAPESSPARSVPASPLQSLVYRTKSAGSAAKPSRRYSGSTGPQPPLPLPLALLAVAASTTSEAPSLSSSRSNDSNSTDVGQDPLTPTTSQADEFPVASGSGLKLEGLAPCRDLDGLDCVAEEDVEDSREAEAPSVQRPTNDVSQTQVERKRQCLRLLTSSLQSQPSLRRTPATPAQVPLVPGKAYTFDEVCSAASLITKTRTFPSAPLRSSTFRPPEILQPTPLAPHSGGAHAHESSATASSTRTLSRRKSQGRSASPSASYKVVASSSPSLRQLLAAAETALPPSSVGSLSRAGSSASRKSRIRSQSPFDLPPAPRPPSPTLVTPSQIQTPAWVKNLRALGEPLKAYEPPPDRALPPARPPRPAKSVRRQKKPLQTREELLNGADQEKSAEERAKSVGFVMPAEVRRLDQKGKFHPPQRPVEVVEEAFECEDPVKAWAMMAARGIDGLGMLTRA